MTEDLLEQSARRRGMDDRGDAAATLRGEAGIPNTPGALDDFSALSRHISNVSDTGQLTALASEIWDQIAYNRTIDDINKRPGDYLAEYAGANAAAYAADAVFLERLLEKARSVGETKGAATWQQNPFGISAKVAELVGRLRPHA